MSESPVLTGAITAAAFGSPTLPTVVGAMTWNANSDFSTTNNPNGVWSYHYGSVTSHTLYTSTETLNGVSGWYYAGGTLLVPLVLDNPSSSPVSYSLTAMVPAESLVLQPWINASSDPVDSIVQWTAPCSGTYAISGFFERSDSNSGAGVGVTFAVDAGGAQNDSGTIGSSDYTRYTFAYDETLKADQTMDFIVGPGNNSSFLYDSTGFDATITSSVPEPGAGCGAGFHGCCAFL